MTISNMPGAEVDIDEALIRRLLREQHDDLAALPLRIVANGWDNTLARLGEDLVVRLPRRAAAAELIEHEQRWLPRLAEHLPLPVPAPRRCGVPGAGYPWAWSICPWFDGSNAAVSPPRDPMATAALLGRFLAALHTEAPADAPANPYRGVPLRRRQALVERYLARLGSSVDARAVLRLWNAACALNPHDGPPLWLHGDLHPANIVVRDSEVAAVVDFGDLTGGDPATDISIAWMLLPPEARPAFRAALGGVDDVTWRRAAGNGLAHALACLASSADNAPMAAVGRRTLDALLADRDLAAGH